MNLAGAAERQPRERQPRQASRAERQPPAAQPRRDQPPRPRPPRMPAPRRSARACCRRSGGMRRPRGGTAASTGPRTPLAHAAPAPCATCGFLVRLGSPLGRVFGVCANEYAPDDGKVVSLDHGCGAHSEAITPHRLVRHASPRSSMSLAMTSSTRRASPWPRPSSSRSITPSRRARGGLPGPAEPRLAAPGLAGLPCGTALRGTDARPLEHRHVAEPENPETEPGRACPDPPAVGGRDAPGRDQHDDQGNRPACR